MITKLSILLLGLWLVVPIASAIEESRLPEVYTATVTPILDGAKSGMFSGARMKKVAHAVFEPAAITKGNIVLAPGYSESYLKYGEVIFDLLQAGYSVYAMDHRGMGLSERLADDPQIVHVESFADYVADLKYFVTTIVQPAAARSGKPMFLVAHSTGALIGIHLLAEAQALFAKVVMTAPLLGVKTGAIPEVVARAVASLYVTFGAGANYVPTYGPFDPQTATLAKSRTTHSAPRFSLLRDLWLKNPKTVMSGPSNLWVVEAIDATYKGLASAKDVRTPILVFQAGDDLLVDNPRQLQFCAAAPSCQSVMIKGAYHELFMEQDAYREEVIRRMLVFFGEG